MLSGPALTSRLCRLHGNAQPSPGMGLTSRAGLWLLKRFAWAMWNVGQGGCGQSWMLSGGAQQLCRALEQEDAGQRVGNKAVRGTRGG